MIFSHKIQRIGSKPYNPVRPALLMQSTTAILRPLARAIHSTGGLDVQTVPPSNTVTPLQKILHDSIRAKGPISVAQYMQMCLSHPVEGYYMKGEPIGVRGDFITSPEISQLFGELVGIWLVSQWLERGQSRPIRMVELGPGKGTLMNDMLRTLESIGQTRGRVQAVHLVETSVRLQEEQKNRLGARIPETLLHWHDRVEDIPKDDNAFTLLVAHEFFDAIPIHIIEKTPDGGFQEVLVDIDQTAQTMKTSSSLLDNAPSPLVDTSTPKHQPSTFRYVLSGRLSPLAHTLGNSSPRFSKVPGGSRIEVSPTSWGIARTVGELISRGGAGLVIDYGDDRVFGSSFRAFQRHKLVDVFHEPGLCDLTANVDFAYLKEAFGSTSTIAHGPLTQHAFLTSMGAPIRLHRLLQGAKDDETRERLRKGAARLMDLLGMGKQYKVMGVTSGEKQGPVYPFGV